MTKILFYLARPYLKRSYFTKTDLLAFYQSLPNLEEGKCPTPALSSPPVPPKGVGQKLENHFVKFTARLTGSLLKTET